MNAEELRARLLQSGLCSPAGIKGCSDADISKLEDRYGSSLPVEYKKLLKVIGRGAGDFSSDVTMFYPAILYTTEKARKLLAESSVKLPDDAFVFANRYGEQLFLFHTGTGSPDPEIYRWHDEVPNRFRKVFKSIWAFIEEELNYHEAMLRDDNVEEE